MNADSVGTGGVRRLRNARDGITRCGAKKNNALYSSSVTRVPYLQLIHHAWKEYSVQLHRLGQRVLGRLGAIGVQAK